MPRMNSRYAVVLDGPGTLAFNNAYLLNGETYTVSYMGGVYPARLRWHFDFYNFGFSFSKGAHVVVDRRIPLTELTIIGIAFGDDLEGTHGDGTGGVTQPSDGDPTGTISLPGDGWFRIDLGPGFDRGRLHP